MLLSDGMVDPFYIMNNARIHHYRGLAETIERLGLTIKYLPPYSPFLNPIENVFSVWKQKVLDVCVMNEPEFETKISEVFSELNSSMCEGFFKNERLHFKMSGQGNFFSFFFKRNW